MLHSEGSKTFYKQCGEAMQITKAMGGNPTCFVIHPSILKHIHPADRIVSTEHMNIGASLSAFGLPVFERDEQRPECIGILDNLPPDVIA